MSGTINRRGFLKGSLATSIAAAAWHPAVMTGLFSVPPAAAQALPSFPAGLGRGLKVAVIGAGVSGLTTAYELLQGGFDVTIFEGQKRFGGRSLTVRPADPDYRAWAIARHPFLDDASYCDYIPAEVRGPKVPEQKAEFVPFKTGPSEKGDDHFETYFNAGPGRIPTFHTGVLHYCRKFGIVMEPYIFVSEDNLLQADSFNGGEPVQIRQFLYDLQGHISALLYGSAGEALGLQEGQSAGQLEAQLKRFLKLFGDLTPSGDFAGTTRSGYSIPPGAGTNAGVRRPALGLTELLEAQALWPDLMASANLEWQLPLLEPRGGMDMIWQALLAQTIEGSPLRARVKLSHHVIGLTRKGGDSGPIDVTFKGPDGDGLASFDYVVMTDIPPQLLEMRLDNVVDAEVRTLIGDLLLLGAGKYGWQARSRFWEAPETGIFGGISYVDHIIDQIWYPSDGYNGPTGILTGAYMFNQHPIGLDGRFWLQGEDGALTAIAAEELPLSKRRAAHWAAMTHEERTAAALDGGKRLHPELEAEVYKTRGLSVSWDNQPFQRGVALADMPSTRPQAYARLTQPLDRDKRLFLAGDSLSYWRGWQEGAVRAAWWSLEQLREQVLLRQQ